MKTSPSTEKMEFYLSIYLFVKKYFILFLIFIVLGAAFGIYKYKTRKTFYKKEIVLYSDDISYIIMKQITFKLSSLLSAGTKESSLEKKAFDENDLKNIISIKTDSISLKGRIYTLNTVVFSDTSGITGFTQKLVKFISNDDYAKRIINENFLRYKKMLEKLNEKLNEIELLMNNKSLTTANSLYRDYFELYSKKLDLEEKLSKTDIIEVVRDTTIVQKQGFGLIASMIIYSVIFFVFSLLIALLIDLISKVRRYEKTK